MQKGDFMNPIELGKFLATLRNEKGLTQDNLASLLFIDKRKISRWECGTSIPDFDTLIKLSEIFDVTLYELSICKRVKLNNNNINKFKNIKDLRSHKIRKIILYILIIILVSFGIFSSIYTIKNYNAYSVYELKSLDEDFYIHGNIVEFKNNNYIFIYKYKYPKKNELESKNDCEYEVLQEDNKRLLIFFKNDTDQLYNKTYIGDIPKSNLQFVITCNKDNPLSYPFIITK